MKTLNLILLLTIIIISPLNAIDFPEIKNWKPAGDISTYNQETLFEYINGAADAFLSYGFQNLKTRVVSFEGTTVTVDIYDMGSRLNAYGIYRLEQPREQETLKIGTEAVISEPYQCLLLKDSYYVKMNVFEGEITETNGKALLTAVAKALPGKTEFPKAVQQLPKKGKMAGSEDFIKKDFLGFPELKNCVYAKYKEGEKDFFNFVIIPVGAETNETIFKQLSHKWTKLEHKKHSVLYRKAPHKGISGVMLTNNKLLGVTDCADEFELVKRLDALLQ